MRPHRAVLACGGALLLLAATLLWHAAWPAGWLSDWLPVTPRGNRISPWLFVVIAACLILRATDAPGRASWLRRVADLLPGLLVLVPGALLLESALHVWSAIQSHQAPLPERAGRLSPNATLAFIAGAVVLEQLRHPRTRLRRWLALLGLAVMAGIAAGGLLGYLLRLELLYQVASFNRLLPTTAGGLLLAAAGLWPLVDTHGATAQRPSDDNGRRILKRAGLVLALVAVAATVSGFAVLRTPFEQSVRRDMLLAASTTATALSNTLEAGQWVAQLMATRPGVRAQLGLLAHDPANAGALRQLQAVADSLTGAQLAGARFLDARGQPVAGTGALLGQPRFSQPLQVAEGEAWLLWDQGYRLRAVMPIRQDGIAVGSVVVEQRLALFDRQLDELRGSGLSMDAVVCGRAGTGARCAPSRQLVAPFDIRPPVRSGTATLMLQALQGERRVDIVRDQSGTDVVAAALPIGTWGVALAVKSDVVVLYAPLRERLQWLVLAIAGAVLAGTLALRSLVQPLLDDVLVNRSRLKSILDQQHELVSLARRDGVLTFVNPAYARFFGQTLAAMPGTNLFDHVPPAERATVAAHLAQVLDSGSELSTENRVLLPSGRGEAWVAWSNSCQVDPSGEVLVRSVGRDITARKTAELALAQQQRTLERQAETLRAVTEAVPAAIALLDRALCYRWINSAFEHWVARPRGEIVGRSIEEVFGTDDYTRILPWARQALEGHTVQFERSYPGRERARHMRITYIPTWSAGEVDGFVGVAQDITEQHEEAVRLLDLTRRDALTGLLNRSGLDEYVRRRSQEKPGRPLGVLYIDLDHFKPVNDAHGHAVGDEVLRLFARRVRAVVRPSDAVARIGGDEFAVVLLDLEDAAVAGTIADKIIAATGSPFHVGNAVVRVGASIGVASGRAGEQTWPELAAAADARLYQAKARGRGQHV